MDIKTVGVVGAGTMGNGIAHVFARSGYQVILCDVKQEFLDRAVATIGKNLEREVAKEKISAADREAAHDFDESHHRHGIEEVHADDLLRASSPGG